MDIKILHSWLKKYLQTNATPQQIGQCLALCGPSVEKVNKYDDDWLYEIEVTTNRVDMMSVYGIAREAATILPTFGIKAELKKLEISKPNTQVANPLPLKINSDPKLNHRVMAIVLDNIKIAKSPKWLTQVLEANGIRSLNSIIDITNYVMTEIGHPCHVLDYDRIKGNTLTFRLSKKDEKIITLDKKTYKLPGNDIVVEDIDGNIVDLPGIMGTANSVVTNQTERIIFFLNNNDAKLMRQTSMTCGIRTMAVTLNEKNVDPELAETALLRGISLYQDICSAKIASSIIDHYHHKPQSETISISLDYINDKLGVEVKDEFVVKTLESLGFKVKVSKQKIQNTEYLPSKVSECEAGQIAKRASRETKLGNIQYTVSVPSWRSHDITIPVDIVEEISRIYGYHNLPTIIPQGDLPPVNPQSTQFYWENKAKYIFKYLGLSENYNYSLIPESLITKINDKPDKYLKLKNPLSIDWLYMRRDIYPSLLQALADNQNRVGDIKFFELANIYLTKTNDLPDETMTLSLVENNNDFYKTKGTLEYLAKEFNLELKFQSATKPRLNLDPKIQADIYLNNQKIGYIGKLSSQLQQNFDIKTDVIMAQLNFAPLANSANKDKVYQTIPKYPAIIENLTFFNEKQVPVSQIIDLAQTVDPIVKSVKVIDVYQNKINLELTYQNPRKNLNDKDIIPIRKNLVKTIEKLGTKLQGEI